ncbi:MAG: hypothetical protein R3D98_01435 [Candidatus Krumholzibacteriia bacterium]
MTRPRLVPTLVAVVLLHLVVAGWFALHRPIDGDEGYYGLAASLVSEGRQPYADFFYPQAPLLPYVYAPFARLVGAPQLPGLRLWSVALGGLALALLAAWAVRAHGGRPWIGVAALLLAALSPELLTWLVTVKTYALTAVAAAAAVSACVRVGGPGRRAWLWGAPVAWRWDWAHPSGCCSHRPRSRPRCGGSRAGPTDARGSGRWLLGLAIGVLPLLLAWHADPARFWFDNLGYHRLRFSALEDAPVWQRASAALQTLAMSILANPGLLVLVGLGVAGLRPRPPREAAADAAVAPSVAMATVYTLTCLAPDPVYMQYFTGVLPILLVPAAARGLGRLRWPDTRVAAAAGGLMAAAALLSLSLIRHDLAVEPHWQLDQYRRVCGRIAAMTHEDDIVFAFWSGYPAGSGRRPLPGMENHFGVGVSERLDRLERRRYRIIGREELARAFRGHEAALAVVGTWMYDINTALDPQMVQLLGQFTGNYELVEQIDDVKLCRPAAAPPAPGRGGG